jgi:hypothetical protein
MATALDVWIAKQGSACRVDDQSWTVTVYDAHNQVFQWAGISYAALPAPIAHWTGSIPPGTYVVQAVSKDKGIKTDHAIVTVRCGETACVLLFVAPSEEPPRPHPERCAITITEVVGLGERSPNAIQVTGTAVDCKKVKVSIACATSETDKTVVSVPASGKWTAILKDIKALECRCGKPVTVIARCEDDPECVTRLVVEKLRCKSANTQESPK